MIRVALRVAPALIGILVASALTGSFRWHRQTAALVATLPATAAPAVFHEEMLAGLPVPVQRYFRAALRQGQPMIRSAVARQQAEFFINGAWRPLTATQHFRASPPAFVWDARIAMAPLMPAYVRDSYVDGHGAMRASLYGLIKLVDAASLHELNLGALQRFLGEAIWLPTALLPSNAVRWTPKDDRSAIVTLSDSGNDVSLVFEFDDTGMVKAISGDRYKEALGHYSLEKWSITCGDPGQRDGIRIPRRCEVAWMEDGLPAPYWRGRIETIEYDYQQ